jgi:hypothetical protein
MNGAMPLLFLHAFVGYRVNFTFERKWFLSPLFTLDSSCITHASRKALQVKPYFTRKDIGEMKTEKGQKSLRRKSEREDLDGRRGRG